MEQVVERLPKLAGNRGNKKDDEDATRWSISGFGNQEEALG